MRKCNVCKCFVGDDNCPCHYVPDDELCDFSFELIDMASHDSKVNTDMIDKIDKLLMDRFTCDDLRTVWTNADIRETIHFELEKLKDIYNDD